MPCSDNERHEKSKTRKKITKQEQNKTRTFTKVRGTIRCKWSEIPLLTCHSRRVLFVVGGKKVRRQLGD